MADIRAVVFDLYGTLVDMHSVAELCERYFPGQGKELISLWRQKQLEYTWLRTLMGRYTAFEDATADALNYCAAYLQLEVDAVLHRLLCDQYLHLSPHADVHEALSALDNHDMPLAVLSNGSKRSIDAVITNAGLRPYFRHLLSVDDLQVFKPDMRVYQLAERTLGVGRGSILFVSSNGWDIAGAATFGFVTCWVNRTGQPFEEMGKRPAQVTRSVADIPAIVL